jgi:hypothetical protein
MSMYEASEPIFSESAQPKLDYFYLQDEWSCL